MSAATAFDRRPVEGPTMGRRKETIMSEFLYVFRGGQDMAKASASDKQANMAKWQGGIKGLAEKGIFKAGQPLHGTGKVLRGRGKTVTDGPSAQAKDVGGGGLPPTRHTQHTTPA